MSEREHSRTDTHATHTEAACVPGSCDGDSEYSWADIEEITVGWAERAPTRTVRIKAGVGPGDRVWMEYWLADAAYAAIEMAGGPLQLPDWTTVDNEKALSGPEDDDEADWIAIRIPIAESDSLGDETLLAAWRLLGALGAMGTGDGATATGTGRTARGRATVQVRAMHPTGLKRVDDAAAGTVAVAACALELWEDAVAGGARWTRARESAGSSSEKWMTRLVRNALVDVAKTRGWTVTTPVVVLRRGAHGEAAALLWGVGLDAAATRTPGEAATAVVRDIEHAAALKRGA